MIVVLGHVLTQPDTHAQVLALSQAHVERSRAEPGCVSHAVHQDSENPLRLVFVEEWESQAALWEHFKVPASRAFGKALASLAAEPPGMTLYEATPLAMPGKAGS